MRGKGIRDFRQGIYGHQYIHFTVDLPKRDDLTEAQVEALETFVKEDESKPEGQKTSKTIFGKIKVRGACPLADDTLSH